MRHTEHAIRVRDVSKSFVVRHGALAYLKSQPRRKPVLSGVNLDVRRGELLGLLGPNGAGKTTLLKMMATLTIPDSGAIEVDGIDIAKDPVRARARIGFCNSDDRSFYFRLTARENLEFFGAMVGLRGSALQRRIEATLQQVALGEAVDRRFGEFSSGMRQRLIVARALLADPDILFFDEPTRAVDPIHADELRGLIRAELVRGRGKTVILATNILEEAWTLCDRIAVVSNGTIAAVAPPAQLHAPEASRRRYRIELNGKDGELCRQLRELPNCDVTAIDWDGRTTSISLALQESSLNGVLKLTAGFSGQLRSFSAVDPSPIELFKAITAHGV